MKRIGIIAALFLMFVSFSVEASAQFLRDVPDMKGKFNYGGGFNFGISGSYLNLAVSPQIGYRIFNPWEVGARGIYNLKCYFRYNEYYHYFGFAPYTNVEFFKGLFVHAEYETIYGWARFNHEFTGGKWFGSLFVGGGYRSYSYSGNYSYFMVLYNLSWSNQQLNDFLYPYGSPIVIRVGYCF